MSTIEKLFAQIFDRKRQIIENLKYQKQLYDQHLLSKLVIQGIPPPPWLLSSDSHSSTSDLTGLNKEELISGLLLPRPGPFASYPSGPCFLHDKPVITAADSGLPDETCAGKSASSNGVDEDRPGVAPPCQVDGTEDTAGVILPCHVGGTEDTDTFNYVPMSPEDQTDTRFSNSYKPEQSLAKIQRSRSRQKALELRNSAKTSAKSRLGMENDVGFFSESNVCRYDDQLGLRRSLELDEPFALPAEICSNRDVAIENCSNKQRSACGLSVAQSTGFSHDISSREVATGNCSDTFRSGMEDDVGSSSENNTCRYDEQLGLKRSLELDEPSLSPAEICSNQDVPIGNCTTKERSACGRSIAQSSGFRPDIWSKGEVATGNCSDKEKSVDASCGSFVYLTVNEAKEVEKGIDQKIEECCNIYGGRIPRSRRSCKQSVDGAHLLNITSTDACVGRITRSKSGLTLHAETHNKITRSKSGEVKEAETRFQRSISRDVSVEPKQLDFDEVEDSNMNGVPTHLSGYISQDTLEERFKAPTIEKSSSSPGAFSTGAYPLSFASKTLEAPGGEIGHALSKGDKISGRTLIFQDCVGVNAMDGSWPCYKRRKIEFQNPNKSSSPTLRLNSFKAINENITDRSAWSEKENTRPMSDNSGAALSDCTILAKETDQSVPSSPSKELVLNPQVECGKDQVSLGEIAVASACEHQKSSKSDTSNVNQSIVAEPTDSFPEDGKVKTNGPSAASWVSGGLMNDQDLIDYDAAVNLMDSGMAADQRKSHPREHEFKLSVVSPLMEFMNVAEAEQTMPEFEGFVIGENAVDAQISEDELVHEEAPFLDNKMDRTCTPVSPFLTSGKLYFAPGVYSSVPNGLLENIDLQSDLLPSGSDLLRKFHSDIFSYPSRQYGWDTKKPFLSPVGKGFESVTSKSGGSDRLGSSNLELTCFPIMEDPESGEEDVNDAVNTSVVKTSSNMENCVNREPLLDVNRHNASSLAPDHADEGGCLESVGTNVMRTDLSTRSKDNKESHCDIAVQNESSLAPDHTDNRCSLGSVCTEISNLEMHNDSKKSSMGQRKSRQTRLGKENKGFSAGAYSSKKHSKPPSSRFSKSKLSGKSSLRSRGQSLSEKEKKCNNIVSNIKSFVPLVQQKQAAAVLPEKRDVKVKALQAAEAAKRAAEIKENERKQKKEAMKLERARVEQENLKEMELKRKLKEEQKMKREAENAAKKRQREEEEKKEKERKKQRIEEARLQHKQAEEKLQVWKEESRCAAEEERVNQRKECNEKLEKQFDKGYEGKDSEKPVNDSVAVGCDRRETGDGLSTLIDQKMSIGSSATGKVDMAESSTPNFDKDDKPNHQTSASQSYDISPYQCSDDEDEEVDKMPNKKFVPAWASKSCVALALSSLQHVDPDVIFPPGSFCSLEEVLLPRRLPQK